MDCDVILIPLRFCLTSGRNGSWLFSLRPDLNQSGCFDCLHPALHVCAALFLSGLPKRSSHPMIGGSCGSKMSVTCAMSNSLAGLLLQNPSFVCGRSKHCRSSCEQQAMEPTSPEPPWLSGPMQNLISSLPPPTALVGGGRGHPTGWMSEWWLTLELIREEQ